MSKATFFLIGVEAEKYPGLTKRIYAEGHEIGNHTFTHPDISNVNKRYFEVELNLTERFFEGKLGVKPVLFRPPYSIDQEPDTADQVRPWSWRNNWVTSRSATRSIPTTGATILAVRRARS